MTLPPGPRGRTIRLVALRNLPLAVCLLAACGAGTPPEDGRSAAPAATLAPGFDRADFGDGVRPQDDFFEYVNGGWLQRVQIPEDKSSYGAFTELFDAAEQNLRRIIQEAARADVPPESDEGRIGAVYRAFMDAGRIEALGLAPLQPELARIAALEEAEQVVRYMGHAQTIGVSSPVLIFVNQDARNALEYVTYASQGGLGLPDRDYYLLDDERFVEIRSRYREYVEALLALAGADDPAADAARVLSLEMRLARAHWSRVRNRDRDATYNRYDLAAAAEQTPGLDWSAFLSAAGVEGEVEIVLRQPDFFAALGRAVVDVPVADWRVYFRYHLVNHAAPCLPQRFVDLAFDFYGRTLRGVEENRPRWKRGVAAVEQTLGEALGRLYVERHFQPDAKARMDDMVANLRAAFARAIDELTWMSEQTRAEAQRKLARFTSKIGYPDRWKDYSGLVVDDQALLATLMASARLEHRRMIDKLGKPIDRGEWFLTPQTVNAYYNPQMNEIVFPAAILQPPFFDVAADDAVNYGAIGAVIGHEFSHGFDDQGRKSDGDGNLRDWWAAGDAEEFQRRAGGLIDQYSAYSPLEGFNVNGELTLGENIGDLAGVTMAWRAYRLSLDGAEPPVIEGFTGDQRFFIGWAQVWRRKYREEELRRRLVTDPHSPSRYRVIGVLSNMDPFYEAFDVAAGDAMYRPADERVKIW